MTLEPGQKVRVVRLLVGHTDVRHIGEVGRILKISAKGYHVLLDSFDEEAIFQEGELVGSHLPSATQLDTLPVTVYR